MADEEWRTNSAHLNCEGQLRELLEFIEDGGRSALEFKKLNPDDRKTIEIGLKRLRPAVDQLCNWFIEPLRQSRPSMADYGHELLWAVLGHAWALGAKADVPESSRSFWQSERAKGERPKTSILNKAILEKLELNPRARANLIHKELIGNPPPGISADEINAINQITFDSIVSRVRGPLLKKSK
jgi:hypothetical protein